MSVRLVRCPFCGKRFDIAGVAGGTRLKCTSCTAVLTVPRTMRVEVAREIPTFFQRAPVQVAAALVVSAGLAFALYLALRPAAGGPVPSVVPLAATSPAPKVERKAERTANPGIVDWDTRLLQTKLKLRDEFGYDRIRFKDDARPFLVAVERGERYSVDSVIKEYAARLLELYDFFRREFAPALDLPEITDVLTVVVLSSRDSYDAYTRRVNDGEEHSPQIKGVYEFTRERIVMYHDPVSPFEVILHEGVHQLVHHYTKRVSGNETVPTTQWFQEGLGTYFEGFQRAGNGQLLLNPEANRSRLPAIQQAIREQNGTYMALGVLAGLTIDRFWDWYRDQRKTDDLLANRMAQTFYAESWALVHYLRSDEGRRRAFDAYFRLELQGKGGKESFEQILRDHLGQDLLEFENDFRTYVQTLK